MSLIIPPSNGALALVFDSDKPCYSYLRLGQSKKVVEAREKQVISRTASAGTYWYRSAKTYMDALAHVVEHKEKYQFGGAILRLPCI